VKNQHTTKQEKYHVPNVSQSAELPGITQQGPMRPPSCPYTHTNHTTAHNIEEKQQPCDAEISLHNTSIHCKHIHIAGAQGPFNV